MFLVRLAIRNLTRNKKRTLLVALIVAFGIAFFVMFDSLVLGLERNYYNNVIDFESGHLQLVDDNYWTTQAELPLSDLIAIDDELQQSLAQVPELKSYAPQIRFSANINNGLDELPITAVGVDGDRKKDVFKLEEHLVAGELFSADQSGAVLGENLAQLMDFEIGDYLLLVFTTQEGAFNTLEVEIVGLVNTPNPQINEHQVYIPYHKASTALNLKNKATEVILRLENNNVIKAKEFIKDNIIAGADDYGVYTWRDSAQDIVAITEVHSIENRIISSLFLLIAAVGIINVIILAALERIKEIGMMKAMGMKEEGIIKVFMIEGLGIGLIGSLLGSLMGGVGVYWLSNFGIDLTGAIDSDFGLPVIERTYGVFNPSAFTLIITFSIVISLLASIFPAYWAACKSPIDALGGTN
ncbi:ABC transporter permease [Natroniella sulfidigena]|uniref:ABC transporter permease n=1 Tax=Natroniella sulfidigena TaxID=723921 RepID=UPI00200AD649|nr:FtsX-like permease family protein [Natroniella sulfidigena]MCK8817852.1 ABC transporter permease [Natroniella sulfidigena]